MIKFKDRVEAGKKLAQALKKYQGQDIIIYALPRGGVILGAEIAKQLKAPLELLIIRKVGHPLSPEYAICAISENGQMVCNEEELAQIDKKWFEQEVEKEKREADRRRKLYWKERPSISAKDKIAIIVDDGIATGLTMEAAILEIKNQQPKKVVVAVPITSWEAAEKIKPSVDEFIALEVPEDFMGAVGAYYDYFPQVTDQGVIDLIHQF